MTANPDVITQLTAMMMDEKRKAYDAGALAMMDSVIVFCEVSGGRLSTKQLDGFKAHIKKQLQQRDQQHGDQTNDETVQPGDGVHAPQELHASRPGPITYLQEREAEKASARQGGEGQSQAEQGEVI